MLLSTLCGVGRPSVYLVTSASIWNKVMEKFNEVASRQTVGRLVGGLDDRMSVGLLADTQE